MFVVNINYISKSPDGGFFCLLDFFRLCTVHYCVRYKLLLESVVARLAIRPFLFAMISDGILLLYFFMQLSFQENIMYGQNFYNYHEDSLKYAFGEKNPKCFSRDDRDPICVQK